jgi:pSer/pThr/pTyr-binding forkhead associated (FHA) protein
MPPNKSQIENRKSQKDGFMGELSVINASLMIRALNEIKHILLLPGERIKFGRDHSNDIRLALFPLQDTVFQVATADISRQHFIVRRRENGYTIQDMGSTNGTSVNCIAVLKKEKLLYNGEIIDIGGVLDFKVILKDKVLHLQRITNTPQESYLLFPEEITIGSSEENAVMLTTPGVAAHHARIRYRDYRYTISNVDTEGIIIVNGIPLEKQEWVLEDESHITLGETEVLFKLHYGVEQK